MTKIKLRFEFVYHFKICVIILLKLTSDGYPQILLQFSFLFTIYLHYFENQHCNFHFWLETQVPKNPLALDLQHISYNKHNQLEFWKKWHNLKYFFLCIIKWSKILQEFWCRTFIIHVHISRQLLFWLEFFKNSWRILQSPGFSNFSCRFVNPNNFFQFEF